MKKQYKIMMKIVMAALFLVALAINVKVTLEDPFTLVSEQAVAECTGCDESYEEANGWFWKEINTPVTITESSGGGFSVNVLGSGGSVQWDGTSQTYNVVKEVCVDGWSACDLSHWF